MGDERKINSQKLKINNTDPQTPKTSLSKNSIIRIEITPKVEDTRAVVRLNKLNSLDLSAQVTHVKIVDVYTIDKYIKLSDVQKIAQALSSPVTEIFSYEAPLNPGSFNFALEVGYLPGVTDNAGHTAKETIEDLLKEEGGDWQVYSSQITFVSGSLTVEDAHKIADSLHNPLIQRAKIKNAKQFEVEHGMDIVVPKVNLVSKTQVSFVDLNVSDGELVKIGKEGIENPDGSRRGPLALDLNYMKTIREYFREKGRSPTDIELESIAQTWSEHCKHTIFANPLDEIKDGLFKTYIKGATDKIISQKGSNNFVAKVFNDNSGAIVFDKEYLITHKVETHNTPSALDPFGGAVTGIVGVNRDALGFGLGAKPVFNTYGFCFADPDDVKPLYKGKNKTQKMLPPKRIMEGVVAGVNAGGNQSGIPTPQGFLWFDNRFKGKPLVFCGTVGLIPQNIGSRDSKEKKALPSDLIVMVGGKVGLDGIHGATFSSEVLESNSPQTAVQIGDPITQKKFSDALIKEARDLGLYNSITDNGAGGLSSSVAEMAREAGGFVVDLEKVPLKYPGLEPWQIWISESQERMTLAVPKDKWEKLKSLMEKRGSHAYVIGEFNNSKKAVIKYNGDVVFDIDMDFLHDGLPKESQKSIPKTQYWEEPGFICPDNLTESLHHMLGRLNICSYEFISDQFDHTVQGLAVTYPLQGKGRVNSENAVVRPRLDSDRGLVLSQGLYPSYSDIDTYHMAASSIDTAFKNAVVAGADPFKIALLDNFCWCSSNEPERLYQLKLAAKACYDYAVAFNSPFISGKDSMFNDFSGFDENGDPVKISIPPTLLISSLGTIEDLHNAVTLDAKFSGDFIYILGETFEELGGSEYYESLGFIGKSIPKVDAKKNFKLYLSYAEAAKKGLIASAVGINRGGLAVALAKTSVGGMLGIEVELKNLPGKISRDDFAIYSESQGRILVTVDPENQKDFEKIMKGNKFAQIGKVMHTTEFKIMGQNGDTIVKTDLEKLRENYKERFKNF